MNELKIDFIGIGSIKAGTSWLGECLRQHLEIGFSGKKRKKELNFFNTPHAGGLIYGHPSYYHKGFDWYGKQFPDKGKVKGEFSVAYLPDPKAPKRIRKAFPRAKIIVGLRDPVDMLYSYYCAHHKLSVAWEAPSTFEEFWQNSPEKDLGLYYRHLSRYFKLFPQEQFYIVLLEDIKNDSRKVVKKMFEFLGVDSSFVPPIVNKKFNPTRQPKSEKLAAALRFFLTNIKKSGGERLYHTIVRERLINSYVRLQKSKRRFPPLKKEIKNEFKKYYLDDIENLEGLIGRNLEHWK